MRPPEEWMRIRWGELPSTPGLTEAEGELRNMRIEDFLAAVQADAMPLSNLRTVVVEQAQIIAEMECARLDLVEMSSHPLNFLRALLAQAREVIAPTVVIGMYEQLGDKGMRLIATPHLGASATHFDITDEDYRKAFDQFLADIKKGIK